MRPQSRPNSRPRGVSSSQPFALVIPSFIVLFLVCLVCLPAVSAASSPPAAASSPPASANDLICHTDNAKDCYPRVFQPTDEFQIVHEDQVLPNGLHVRLNIWTGQKEAKLNQPDEATDPALADLSVDRAVVVVDPETAADEAPPVRLPRGAPAYEAAGKIKKPPTSEAESFGEALATLKAGKTSTHAAFDAMLESLEDLSHDIYYGLKIAEDAQTLEALLRLITGAGPTAASASIPRDQQAASILASAVQNNPTALKAVAKEWTRLMSLVTKNSQTGESSPLRQSFYRVLPLTVSSEVEVPRVSAGVRAKISAISGLIKSPTIRDDFLANGGMEHLLEVLLQTGEEWEPAQKKLSVLLLDNFLDEDMGATLGVWPRTAQLVGSAAEERCMSAEGRTDEGCWAFQVEKIMKRQAPSTWFGRGDDTHWSREVYDRLVTPGKRTAKTQPKDEL